MPISEWITDHESFLSGLAAIAALLGIAGAVTRQLWVRARGLGERTDAGAKAWLVATGAAVGLAIVAWVFLNPRPGEPDPGSNRAGPPTIAVLPLTTMSDVAEHEWLSDGMTEDIITLLARSPALRVIARNSTFQYKGQSVDIREVGEALGADFVVEGSLRPVGDRIRVTVQLIDVGLGTHVWAKKYDRPLADIFALQDEVTTAIAAGVGDELFKVETYRATQASADNLDAWSQTWRADITYSIEDARKAVALDENYGRAHAVLGRNLSVSLHDASTDSAAFAEAIREARRGEELAPEDVIVLAQLGVTLLLSGNPEPALAVLERIPSMSPSYAEGFVWYGDALIHNGRPEEGLEAVNHAIELTPNARMLWVYEFIRAEALIHLGRFDAADEGLRDIELKTSFAAHLAYVAGVKAVTGDADEARRLMNKARALAPDYSAQRFRERYYAISIDKGGPNFQRLFDALEEAIP
jgi:TolB-like protein